ncbi:MAG: GHMP kinase, partial [Flavobacteriaceae bacterium]
ASWAAVDPYQLLGQTFGGSGYDIACAKADGPILFQRNVEENKEIRVAFAPPFKSELFFVYLNQKMSSKEAIAHYRKAQSSADFLNELSRLSLALSAEISDIDRFEDLIYKQENLLSSRLEIPTISDELFNDRPEGVFASLGAWGGDFALFTRKKNIPYLQDKGYSTILKLKELCIY